MIHKCCIFSDFLSDQFKGSCLARPKKDPDTPKKKVTFDMHGKENQNSKATHSTFYTPYTPKFDSVYSDVYSKELEKRKKVTDTIYKAKIRALEIRGIEEDFAPRSKHLLNFR